jgi:hypothetical protein
MKNTNIDCKTCTAAMADLLLVEGYAAKPEMAAHLAACTACRTELAELQQTFALLDSWQAPEPSPYFDSKLHVRLREAVAAAPEGLWERLGSYLKFSTGRHLRPVMAGALAAVLLGGGGTWIGVYQPHSNNQAMSPTVNDLKIMDNNAQALQQMDQLLDESPSNDDAPPTT